MYKEKELKRILNGLVDMVHDQSESYRQYLDERRLCQEILNSMIDYIKKNSLNCKNVLRQLNCDLKLDYHEPIDFQVMNDLVLFKQFNNISSLTEFYLNTRKYKNYQYREMLNAMNESYIGLFRIIERDEQHAIVVLDDVSRHQQIKITDNFLGYNNEFRNNDYLLLRIIEGKYGKFQTGLLFNFPNDGYTRIWINRYATLFTNLYQPQALIEAYKYYKWVRENERRTVV